MPKAPPAQPNTLQSRRRAAGQATGRPADEVALVQLQLAEMQKRVLLVDINFTGEGLFNVRATGGDLGIADSEARTTSRLYTRGVKTLIPPKSNKLHSIGQRAREWTATFSRDLEGFRPYRAIPYTAVPAWREGWDRLTNELDEWKEVTIANLPAIRAWLREEFGQAAEESWRDLLNTRSGTASKGGVIVDGQTFHVLSDFRAHQVGAALRALPSAEQIEEGIQLTFRTAVISTSRDLAAEQAALEKLQAKRERYQAQIAKARKTADLAEIAVLEAKRASVVRLEAKQRAEYEAAKAQLEQMQSPVVEMVAQLRAQLAEKLTQLAENIHQNQGKFVQGRVAEMAAGLMELYETMHGGITDSTLEPMLANLRTAIGPIGTAERKGLPPRDMVQVQAALATLQKELNQSTAKILDAQPSRFRFLEIDDDED